MINMVITLILVLILGKVSAVPLLNEREYNAELGRGNLEARNDNFKISRVVRQDPIVQPGLTGEQIFGGLFKDYNVRVTEDKLEETEAIREYIQDTVDSGSYAVEVDESDFKDDNEQVQQPDNSEEAPDTVSDHESDSESQPESESESESEPEPESVSEPDSESEYQPDEPKFEPAPELLPETIVEPEKTPENRVRSSLFRKFKFKPKKIQKSRLKGLLGKWIKGRCFYGKCKN